MEALTVDLMDKAQSEGIKLASERVDDVLTYALFPQVGLKFLKTVVTLMLLNQHLHWKVQNQLQRLLLQSRLVA